MTSASASSAYRPCAAVLLFARTGRVLVADRIDVDGPAWQLPQGGIDEAETPRQAAAREMTEEIAVRSAEFLAESSDWHPYDVPDAANAPYRGWYRGQRLRFVAFLFTGEEDEIDVATDHPEFRAWKWTALEALPGLIVDFKRPAYEAAVNEFGPLRDRIREGAVSAG